MGYFVQYACMSFTMKALAAAALGLNWSNSMVMLYEVMLWLCYGYVMSIMTASSARREAVLWLPCQLGENKCVCSSDGFSSILPASLFKPCLSFVQQTVCRVRYNKTIDITNRISNTLLSIDIIFDIILFHTEAHHFYCVECVCEHVCGGFHFLRVFIPSLNLQLYFSHWFLLCPMLSFHLLLCSLSFHLLRKTSIIFHCSISLRYNTSVLLILPTQAFGSSQSSDLWLTSFPLSVRIIQSSIPTSYLPQLVQPSGFLISTAHLDRPFPQLLNLKTISIIHLALHFSLNSD